VSDRAEQPPRPSGPARKTHVCPVSAVRTFDNVLRPWVHDPRKLFAPHVKPGMTVLDVGCGRGWATLGLARLVGERGRVIAADLQEGMLALVRERAAKAGLSDRVRFHRCGRHGIGLQEELDFAVAFWMAHEVPDSAVLLAELFSLLKPGGRFLLVEPRFHVARARFRSMVRQAERTGFRQETEPRVFFSRASLLEKAPAPGQG